MADSNVAASRRMNLAVFASAGPVSVAMAAGATPMPPATCYPRLTTRTSVDYWKRATLTLSSSPTSWPVPDQFGDSLDSQLRYGALGALRLDPMVVLGLIAGATKHVGLACTVSTTYFEPFALARSMATLDHLSGGRAAWNIVTSFQEAEARNFGRDEQLSREQRYDRADEFMEVVCALWDFVAGRRSDTRPGHPAVRRPFAGPPSRS